MNGEALRALSDNRELAFQQSAMTVFGTVPPLRNVREIFSDRLAASVGIVSPSCPARNDLQGRAAPNSKGIKP